MKRLLLMCITTFCLSMLYTTPICAKSSCFVLYAGLEEVFDIFNDTEDTNEEYDNSTLI